MRVVRVGVGSGLGWRGWSVVKKTGIGPNPSYRENGESMIPPAQPTQQSKG